ncbi:MAG TPA: amino acid permease [Steroidobacteraceae bacterium]|nr:amino acid permease [Steroidobacteraceae bacterium]
MTGGTASAARPLGLLMCTALVVGNTIGMGIFMLPASLAPYGLNALGAWLITAAGCLMVAWVFAGLARNFAEDDGPYAYARRAFGDTVAFLIMWCYWVSCWVTNAAIAIGVVGYLSTFLPILSASRPLAALTALGLVWLFVLVNLRGLRTAGWVQVASVALKLLPQFAIIALGVWQLLKHPGAYLVHVPATPLSLPALVSASTIALFAMLGVECAAVPAGKVREPARTVPRATFAGTALVALIYLLISAIPLLLIPQKELAASSAPFADLLTRYLGSGSGKLLAAFIVVSGLGALNGWTLVTGEVAQSCARHGSLPPAFARPNSRGAPGRAFLLAGVVASLMLLMNYDDSLAGGFTFLSVVVTAANLPMYFGCSLAVLVLWRRRQVPQLGAREARWMIAAALAVIYCVWTFFGIGARSLLWALVLGLVGVPVYWWYARVRRPAHVI